MMNVMSKRFENNHHVAITRNPEEMNGSSAEGANGMVGLFSASSVDGEGGAASRNAGYTKLVVLVALLILWMVFIFAMSANSGAESQGLSDAVARALASAFWPGFNGFDAAGQSEALQVLSLPIRKAAHFTEYAVLGMLAFFVLRQVWSVRCCRSFVREVTCGDASPGGEGAVVGSVSASRFPLTRAAVLSIAFSGGYAAFDEFHQLFVAGRSGQPTDVLIDTLGASFAVAAIALVVRRRSRRS
jgi:VanZ family protein